MHQMHIQPCASRGEVSGYTSCTAGLTTCIIKQLVLHGGKLLCKAMIMEQVGKKRKCMNHPASLLKRHYKGVMKAL